MKTPPHEAHSLGAGGAAASATRLPERIAHYRVERLLGEGGQGVVYAARDERLGRTVALKTLRAASADARSRERLWREARLAASISHPNVCQVFEVGEEGDELFMTMELLEGESLATRLGRGALPLGEAAPIALAMLAALDVLHRGGMVHRDLKPSNVFLTPHGVKLLDFGLARPLAPDFLSAATDLTLPGTVVGTPRYMAPEHLKGETVDGRADLFVAGAILYEMLSGRRAFPGENLGQVLHAVLHDDPPVLAGSAAIAAMDRVIQRAMAKRPEGRYASAQAMAADLRAAMLEGDSGSVGAARPMTRVIVLPLRVLRPDPETDFLAFSLSDALTSTLAGLGSLVVRSSAAASRFAAEAPDLEAISRQADVDAVVTGNLLRAGDQVRVSTQLVEAPAGTVLCTHTAQVPLGDIFQLQDDLTQRLADSLALPLNATDRSRLRHFAPSSGKAYELYLRALPLSYKSSQWTEARDLYVKCLEEDPRYAPAWAQLGRLHRVIGMYSGEDLEQAFARSQEAFRRALEINPDLSLAHNLYTYLEVETDRAREAVVRLVGRARERPGDPDLFAGLVQACRFCGLFEAALAAYERARRLDAGVRTAIAHVFLMTGEYERCVETDVDDPPMISIFAMALMGRESQALDRLREWEQTPVPRLTRRYIAAMRSALEGDPVGCVGAVKEILEGWKPKDPCALGYLARTLAFAVATPIALEVLGSSVRGGFYPFSFLVRDPWLDLLRGEPEFRAILRLAESRHREARAAFLEAGGDKVLGVSAG